MNRYYRIVRHGLMLLSLLNLCTASVRGNDIHVDITPYVNTDLKTWTAGANYPSGGYTTNYAGITFSLASVPGTTNTLGGVFAGYGSVTTPVTNDFPVNVANAATVYTLLNSWKGSSNSINGTVEFFGAQGAHASFDLKQGLNIRDHYNGYYNNFVPSNIMRLAWGANDIVRLDCQGWMLPANFYSQSLTNIQIKSFGSNPQGVAILAAITVRTNGPVLAIQTGGNQAACYWPSTPTNYVLQTTDSLEHPVWMNVASAPRITNNQFVVTDVLTTSNQFYRLIAIP